MRLHTALLVSTIAACALSATASGQTAGRVVVFGDSLSDNGNLRTFGPPTPPYGAGPNGFYRFSSGLNYIDMMFGPMNSPLTLSPIGTPVFGSTAGNVDMAFGGARTDSLPNANGPIPGLPTQVATFLALGGAFGPNDLVVAWGGANNLFQYAGPLTQAGLSANSVAAADSMANNVLAPIVSHGGRTILVPNLPDFGSLPAYNTVPANASAGTFASTTYNTQLAADVTTLAAANPAANFIQADVAAAFRVVIANPGAFGLTNVTQSCFTGAAVCATPNTYLFWDSVHPTQAGYALLAKYYSALLNTAPAIAQVQSLGNISSSQVSLVDGAVFDRLSNWFSGTYSGKNGPFAEVIGQTGQYEDDTPGAKSSYRFTTGGVRAGFDKAFGTNLVGVSVTALSGAQNGAALSSDVMTFRGDVYGAAVSGPFYVSGNAGITHVGFDKIERDTGFPTVKARATTDALVYSASGEVGAAQKFGGITLVPSGRIGYAHSVVAGFSEVSEVLALNFAEREIDVVTGGVRLRAITDMNFASLRGTMFAEIGYEGFLTYDGGKLTGQLVGNTALPVSINPADATGQGLIGKVGLNGQVSDNVFFDLNYGVALRDGSGEVHTGQARLKAHY
jgi:outer membrane lipase/esterase